MAQKNYMWTIMRRRSGLYDEDGAERSGVWVYSDFEKACKSIEKDGFRVLSSIRIADF